MTGLRLRRPYALHGVFLAWVVFGFAACGESPTEPENVPGTYNLKTVDGRSLPHHHDPGFIFYLFTGPPSHITAWSITLNQDMTWSDRKDWYLTFPSSGAVSERGVTEREGTYTFIDGTVVLTYSGGGTFKGLMSGSLLTRTIGRDVFVFRKSRGRR